MIGLLIEKASALVEDSPFLALFIIFLLGMLVSVPFAIPTEVAKQMQKEWQK